MIEPKNKALRSIDAVATEAGTPPHSTREPLTTSDIIARWRTEGPLVRVPTGVEPLDKLCRGGVPFPWRLFVVGAPSAGKTFLEVCVARPLAAAGVAVGILGVDEEPDDNTVRLAQIAGFSVEQAEARDHATLRAIDEALSALPIRLYDVTWTIEQAGAHLASWAKVHGYRHAALFVDSIQTARSDAAEALKADNERVQVKANVDAVRAVSSQHRMLVVATSEANRAAYRSQQAAEESNDMAAGAETRGIEFSAQTLLMLRTPKDHPNVVHVRVPKNRRAHVGEFWLRLDRGAHSVEECSNPLEPGSAEAADKREQGKRARNVSDVERDAKALCELVRKHKGIDSSKLRGMWRAAGHGGMERLNAALALLTQGHAGWQLVDLGSGSPGKPRLWHCQAVREVADA